jgi:predicted RecA/RadA family phage recombinase
MTTKYKASGKVMDYLATSAIASGAVLVIGSKVAVALTDIANGATGSVQTAGVFEVAKLSSDVVAQGAALYWDAGNSRVTLTVGANVPAGYAFAAAGNAVTTVQIVLNGSPA